MSFALPAVAAIGAIGGIVGTVAQVAGDVANTAAAMQLADYRAEIATRSSKIMLDNATRSIDKAQQDQWAQDQATRTTEGQQITQQGASGIRLGSASFVQSRAATRMIGRLDALNVRQSGELEANNYRIQAQDFAKEAEFEKSTRGNAMIQGIFQGVGHVAGGFANTDFRSLSVGAS